MECEACGGKMNSASVVCPHCGARRAKPAEVKLDNAEMRALLAIEGAGQDDEEREWIATIVLPHRSTYGAARAAELALTVVSLPLVLTGVILYAFKRRSARKQGRMHGEIGPLLIMSTSGALSLWSVLSLAGVSGGATIAIIGGSIAALIARAVIRMRSAGTRDRELHRIDKPPAKLPAANVDAAPAAPVAAPSTSQDAPKPGEQPRLLR